MDLLTYVILFALPALQKIATRLERKDSNSSGADDRAARAIKFAITEVELWVNSQSENEMVIPSNADEIVAYYQAQLAAEAEEEAKGGKPKAPPKTVAGKSK